MSDSWRDEFVTKGAAADAARDAYKQIPRAAIAAMMAIKELPPEQSTEVQDILQYLDKYLHPIVSPEHWSVYSVLYDMVSMLPSVLPQRTKGRWIHDGYDIPHGVDWMHCSVCGRREPHVPAAMTNFCPDCGAWMSEELEPEHTMEEFMYGQDLGSPEDGSL